jgi:hypothetical protein
MTEMNWTHGSKDSDEQVDSSKLEAVFWFQICSFGNDFKRKEIIQLPSRRSKAKIGRKNNWEHLTNAQPCDL